MTSRAVRLDAEVWEPTPKGSKLVAGSGPIPSVGMIIGEAPGEREAAEGRPFVGPSGALLEDALADSGGSRNDFYITNVYKERPPGNRNPTRDELEEHYSLLREEFWKVDPKIVLVLGKVAADFLIGEYKRSTWTLDSRADFLRGISTLPTYHPAYILRNRKASPQFYNDVWQFVSSCI